MTLAVKGIVVIGRLKDESKQMSANRILGLTALLFFAVPLPGAKAFTPAYTEAGQTIRWRYGQKLFLAGNSGGSGSLTPEFFRQSIVEALQQWKWASRGLFDFEYWQGTDREIYETNLDSNGQSSIFFASQSRETVDSNVIGFTQLWYNGATGDLVETDVILNDRQFQFTDRSSDTTSFNSAGARPRVFLPNVVTHELGHAIGLSHSGAINSSMLYVEFLEQAHLGCDDVAGARHLYGSVSSTDAALTGVVINPEGDRVGGVQVIALSAERGHPLASALTDSNGTYTFGSLPAGPVSLAFLRYPGTLSSIPDRFWPKNLNFCKGSAPGIQFLSGPDLHSLEEIQLDPGRVTHAPTFRMGCERIANSGSLYEQVYAPSFFVDANPLGAPRTYSFIANGPFRISSISFELLSPVQPLIEAFDSSGKKIPLTIRSPIFAPASGFMLPETEALGSATGEVTLRVIPVSNAKAPIPFPAVKQSDQTFYVLAIASNPSDGNPRCLPETPLPDYRSPPGGPIRYSSTRSGRDQIGFCGSVAQAEPRGGHASAGAGSILGWFWPFILLGVIQLNSRWRRDKLKASCRTEV